MLSPYDGALHICGTLKSRGFKAYIVGGAVRDRLRGIEPKDYDIATDALPEDVMSIFPERNTLSATHGVVGVTCYGDYFEVTTFRADMEYDGRRPKATVFGKTLEEDALRRDFTINAMYFDPILDILHDPLGGEADLAMGILRFAGDAHARLKEDRLRALRAIRFMAALRLSPEKETALALIDFGNQEDPLGLSSGIIAIERVQLELTKMLTGTNPGFAILKLEEYGFLASILPEVRDLIGCRQPLKYHLEGDVWTHTIRTLEYCDDPNIVCRLAALLHDIAKPATTQIQELPDGTEKITAHNHALKGAEMAEAILKRLKYSKSVTCDVKYLVEHHMRMRSLHEWKRVHKVRRFMGERRFEKLYTLAKADELAACPEEPMRQSIVDVVETYRTRYPVMLPPPLLQGEDLIRLGFRPSYRFKSLLTLAYNKQLEGASLDDIIRILPSPRKKVTE